MMGAYRLGRWPVLKTQHKEGHTLSNLTKSLTSKDSQRSGSSAWSILLTVQSWQLALTITSSMSTIRTSRASTRITTNLKVTLPLWWLLTGLSTDHTWERAVELTNSFSTMWGVKRRTLRAPRTQSEQTGPTIRCNLDGECREFIPQPLTAHISTCVKWVVMSVWLQQEMITGWLMCIAIRALKIMKPNRIVDTQNTLPMLNSGVPIRPRCFLLAARIKHASSGGERKTSEWENLVSYNQETSPKMNKTSIP